MSRTFDDADHGDVVSCLCSDGDDDDDEYSVICYEDMVAAPSSVMCDDTDSDDDLTLEQRAAKRRRIEDIALDYLEGGSIFIMSASLRGPFGNGWVNPWGKQRKIGGMAGHGDEEAIIPETPDGERSLSPARVYSGPGVFSDQDEHVSSGVTSRSLLTDAECVPETPVSTKRWLEVPASACRPRGRLRSARIARTDPSRANANVEWMDIDSSTANEKQAGSRDVALGVIEDSDAPHGNAPLGNSTARSQTGLNDLHEEESDFRSQSALYNGLDDEIQRVELLASKTSGIHATPEEVYATAPGTIAADPNELSGRYDETEGLLISGSVSDPEEVQGTPAEDVDAPADAAPETPFYDIGPPDQDNVNSSGRVLHDVMEDVKSTEDQSSVSSDLQEGIDVEVAQDSMAETTATVKRYESPPHRDPLTFDRLITRGQQSATRHASDSAVPDQTEEKGNKIWANKPRLRASSTILNNRANNLASLRRLQSEKQRARQNHTVPPTQSPDKSLEEPGVAVRKRHEARGVRTVPCTRSPTPQSARRAVSVIPASVESGRVVQKDRSTAPASPHKLPSVIPTSVESERSVMIEEDIIPNSQSSEDSITININNDKDRRGLNKPITYEYLSHSAPRPQLNKEPTSPFVQQSRSSPPLCPVRNASADTWLRKKDTTRIRKYMFKNLPSSPTTEMFISEGKGPGETLSIKKPILREGQHQKSARVEDANEESPLKRVEHLLGNAIGTDDEGEEEILNGFGDRLAEEQKRWQSIHAERSDMNPQGQRHDVPDDKPSEVNPEKEGDVVVSPPESSVVRSQGDIFNIPADTPDDTHTNQDQQDMDVEPNDILINKDGQTPHNKSTTEFPGPEAPEGDVVEFDSIKTSFYSARENPTQVKGHIVPDTTTASENNQPSVAETHDEEQRPLNPPSRRDRRNRQRNKRKAHADTPEPTTLLRPFNLQTSQANAEATGPVSSQNPTMGDEELQQAIQDANSFLDRGRFDLEEELRKMNDVQGLD
ncbi:hypothetical protein AAP_01573 [Ascosphaera apis ARSEF 7405]|uniref:Uncharacterized protein n=1 Tax=Ascosphaera apis ARSEF 7405 TaxID=392613 RepID=A0A168BBS6_9EURO|nr:hypothetical protein AAP_01573 [Ascosphaera apis ARSEF 7405]